MKFKLPAVFLAFTVLVGLPLGLAAQPAAAPRVVKITAGAENAMKFDVARIEVAPGEPITVVLTNAGTLPKTVMGHNWILLKVGTDPVAFAAAASSEADNGYIPTKAGDAMVAHIGLLGPGESGEVTFSAPREPGEYPFLCSFPAHCLVGMKGVVVVK
jgi:azurin